MDYVKCDILVIGGGPAGACAAMEAQKRGAKAIIVEKDKKVGSLLRCAEYIPRALLGEIKLNSAIFIQDTDEMKTYIGDKVYSFRFPGIIIDRKELDRYLVSQAEREGVKLYLGLKAGLIEDGKLICGDPKSGYALKIEADVIIGSDGPCSFLSRVMGMENREFLYAIQCRIRLSRPISHTEVYLSERFFGGYGWLFPKAVEANVGLGIRKGKGKGLKELFEKFIFELQDMGKVIGIPYMWRGGLIPCRPKHEFVKDNMLLCGDAASFTHPISGSGIAHAIISGRMAGRYAASAIGDGKISELKRYEEEWNDIYGDMLSFAWKKRQYMESEWHRFPEIIRSCWIGFREYYEDR